MKPARCGLAIAIVLLFLDGCVTARGATSLQRAEAGYVQASIAYAAIMDEVVALRAERHITDAQWAVVDKAQHEVSAAQPVVRALLDVWRTTGTKPTTFDARMEAVNAAIARIIEATNVQPEVNP